MIISKKVSKFISATVLGAFIATTGSALFPVSAMAAPHRCDYRRPPIHRPIHTPRPIHHPSNRYVRRHDHHHRDVIVIKNDNRPSNAETVVAILGVIGNIIASKNASES